MEEKNGRNYVVDSSVLIKWLVEEADCLEQAQKIRLDYLSEDIGILVPAFVFWELNNYFGRKYDEKTASSIFVQYKNYQMLPCMVTLEMSTLAFKIMKRHSTVSFYDASYHALALLKNATFVTNDKKYYEKARDFGSIQLLKDYK